MGTLDYFGKGTQEGEPRGNQAGKWSEKWSVKPGQGGMDGWIRRLQLAGSRLGGFLKIHHHGRTLPPCCLAVVRRVADSARVVVSRGLSLVCPSRSDHNATSDVIGLAEFDDQSCRANQRRKG